MEAQDPVNAPARGIITNIQRFSLHDGPGVRTTVFFKGCPLRCLWCHNPETFSFQPVLSRDERRCIACGSCAAACAIEGLRLSEDGFFYDAEHCRHCFACAAECPTGALSPLGREATADDVMKDVLPDLGMYGRTGGGVTLSGGEAAAQPAFAIELTRALHAHDIHVALDTCGHVEGEPFLSVCREADLILFDLKHADDAEHKRLTGRDMRLIRRNFRLLSREQTPIQVRIPVIPGLNDEDAVHGAMAALIKANPNVESIVLLGYHPLGGAKVIGLHERRAELSIAPPPRERMAALAQTMAARTGLPCTFR